MSRVDLASSRQEHVCQEGFLTQSFDVAEEHRVMIIPLEAKILARHFVSRSLPTLFSSEYASLVSPWYLISLLLAAVLSNCWCCRAVAAAAVVLCYFSTCYCGSPTLV